MIDFPARSDDCLLIIDVQNDFCSAGALAVPDAEVHPAHNQSRIQYGVTHGNA